MLSKKLTFSLTSLVILLAVGLVITPALAGEFEAYFTAGELMVDVSSDEGLQVRSGRDRATAYPEDADAALALVFQIAFDRVVQLGPNVTTDTVTPDNNPLQLEDFMVDAYDDLGRSLGSLSLSISVDNQGNVVATGGTPVATLAFSTPQQIPVVDPGELPGQQFRLTVDYEALQNAYDSNTGGEFEIHTLFFTLKKAAVADSSIAAIEKYRKDPKDDNKPDTSKGPKFLRVDLVNEDEGSAYYASITSTSTAAAASATDSTATPPTIDKSDPGVVDI